MRISYGVLCDLHVLSTAFPKRLASDLPCLYGSLVVQSLRTIQIAIQSVVHLPAYSALLGCRAISQRRPVECTTSNHLRNGTSHCFQRFEFSLGLRQCEAILLPLA